MGIGDFNIGFNAIKKGDSFIIYAKRLPKSFPFRSASYFIKILFLPSIKQKRKSQFIIVMKILEKHT
jgi:hypothetical protein